MVRQPHPPARFPDSRPLACSESFRFILAVSGKRRPWPLHEINTHRFEGIHWDKLNIGPLFAGRQIKHPPAAKHESHDIGGLLLGKSVKVTAVPRVEQRDIFLIIIFLLPDNDFFETRILGIIRLECESVLMGVLGSDINFFAHLEGGSNRDHPKIFTGRGNSLSGRRTQFHCHAFIPGEIGLLHRPKNALRTQ